MVFRYPKIKNLWEQNLSFEISHLHKAVELLKKYEGKEWQEVIRDGEFPAPISLHENIDYVRNILGNTVQYTSLRENYALIKDLPENYDKDEFARIQKAAEKIQSDSDVLLVIGIGGSYLGARAAIEALNNHFYNYISL